MKPERIAYLVFGIVLGSIVAVPMTLLGLNFFADYIINITVVAVVLLFFFTIGAGLISLYWDSILQKIFQTAKVQLESITDPMGKAIGHAIAGERDEAISNGTECARILLARYSSYSLRRWVIASLFGLLATFAGLATSALMFRQNGLLIDQNEKLDSQNLLIKAQNEVINLQTQIAQQEILPQFVIHASQLKEPGEEKATQDQITVTNSGAVVSELKSKHAIFIDIDLFYTDPSKGKPIKQRLPINGYYSVTIHNPQGQGQMLTLAGNRNNERASSLMRTFREYAKEKGMYGFAEVRRFLHLTYRDQLGEKHSKYYFVPMIFGAHEISQTEGEDAFEMWHDTLTNMQILEFESLTKEKLFEAAMQK